MIPITLFKKFCNCERSFKIQCLLKCQFICQRFLNQCLFKWQFVCQYKLTPGVWYLLYTQMIRTLNVRGMSNRKAKNRNWSNQKTNPVLKTENREQINITNKQNTIRTNCYPSGQLFPKRWPLSNPN